MQLAFITITEGEATEMKYIFASVLFILTAIFPSDASEGVKNGIELCAYMVIPSLFPLMFCTLFIMRTGLARILSKPIDGIGEKLLGLPKGAGFVLFAAMCGGYPAGAAAVKELYKRGSIHAKQAERLALFAFSAGPAFVLGAVGGTIYKSSAVGFMLLGILCVSVIIVGVLLKITAKGEAKGNGIMENEAFMGDAFVTSASDSASALLSVCVFVVLFAYLLSMIKALGLDSFLTKLFMCLGFSESTAQALLPCILEVSGGCTAASKAGFSMVAFALGFGGLSVHFQVFSLLSELRVGKVKFIAVRLIQGCICAFLTFLASPFLPDISAEVLAVNTHISAMPTPSGSVCLTVMCLMAVLCLPKPLTKGEKRV